MQQPHLLGPGHVALGLRQHRAELGRDPAAQPDVEDEEPGHHQAGEDPREPELAHGLARDHGVEHQHHRGRHEDSERAPSLDHARHHALVVVALEQFGQRDGGADAPGRLPPRRAVAGLGAGQRVGDLVQDGVLDPDLARVQRVRAAEADHAVLEVAVAEAPLRLEEGEAPLAEAVLVHQPARLAGAAQQRVGDIPARPARAHPGAGRVELGDGAFARTLRAGKGHRVDDAARAASSRVTSVVRGGPPVGVSASSATFQSRSWPSITAARRRRPCRRRRWPSTVRPPRAKRTTSPTESVRSSSRPATPSPRFAPARPLHRGRVRCRDSCQDFYKKPPLVGNIAGGFGSRPASALMYGRCSKLAKFCRHFCYTRVLDPSPPARDISHPHVLTKKIRELQGAPTCSAPDGFASTGTYSTMASPGAA